jgi:hypothetical protein
MEAAELVKARQSAQTPRCDAPVDMIGPTD